MSPELRFVERGGARVAFEVRGEGRLRILRA
jgi:hypothetical protein